MSRIHFFEIHDQAWCPESVRHGVRDALYTAWKLFFWRNALPHIHDLIKKSKTPYLLDLCSGGGGPMPLIAQHLEEKSPGFSISLSDLFPYKQWENPLSKSNNIQYISEPIDATDVPPGLAGCRTLFESFHHFRPEQAVGILSDAVQSKQPIAIFEFQRPSIWHAISHRPILFVPFSGWLHLFHTPFTWGKLFFTIIPIIPLVLILDGIISVKRTYSTAELKEVAEKAGDVDFRWEIRQSRNLNHGLMTCLIGWPDPKGGVHEINWPPVAS